MPTDLTDAERDEVMAFLSDVRESEHRLRHRRAFDHVLRVLGIEEQTERREKVVLRPASQD